MVALFAVLFLCSFPLAQAGQLGKLFKTDRRKFKEALSRMTVYDVAMKEMADISWACGTNIVLEKLSSMVVQNLCTTGAKNVAKFACFKHDNCYSCQRGHRHCDLKFCAMLYSAVTLFDDSARCMDAMWGACETVRTVGGNAYDKAGTDDECNAYLNDELGV